jgi:lysophospholipase L1-like esterase
MKKISYITNISLSIILLIIIIRENYPQRVYRKLFTQSQTTNSYLNNYQWQPRENYFDQDTISNYEIVMIGNSITQGGFWEQLLKSNSVKNLGIGSDVSEGVLNRVERAINYKPKYLFVEIGINDICSDIPVDTIISNYQKIISKIKSQKIILGITSVISVGKNYPNSIAINKNVELLNIKLRSLSKDNVNFIDLNKELAKDGFLTNELTYDQIHLKPQGYLIYAKILNDFITSSKSNQTHQDSN